MDRWKKQPQMETGNNMSDVIRPRYRFFSTEFREEHYNLYRLSIGLALDGFSFLVQNQNQETLALYSIDFKTGTTWNEIIPELEKILQKFTWLKQPMEKKIALMESPEFTLIPFSLYENNEKRKYLELNHALNKNALVYADMLKDFYSYVIFAQNSKLRNMISQNISDLNWHHYVTGFVKCSAKFDNEKFVAADVRNRRFYVSAFSKNRLMFCNEFRYDSKEDFVYFIMLVYRNLEYDPREVPLKLSGLIQQNSEVVALMKRYIANIEFGDKSEIYHDEQNKNNPYHYQFEILKNAVF